MKVARFLFDFLIIFSLILTLIPPNLSFLILSGSIITVFVIFSFQLMNLTAGLFPKDAYFIIEAF